MSRKQIPSQLRFDVLKRDGFTCQYCGHSAPHVKLHVDHLVPVRSGGTNATWNLITACEGCNLGKSASNLQELLQVRLAARNRFSDSANAEIRDFIVWPLLLRAAKEYAPVELMGMVTHHRSFSALVSGLEDVNVSAELVE